MYQCPWSSLQLYLIIKIPWKHCPSFLYHCCHHLPQVVITIVATTSLLMVYLINFEQNIPQTIDPVDSHWNYLSNEYLCVKIRFRTKELCPFYSSTAFCPEFNSARTAFNDLHIAPCRNLQIEWFLLRWKEDFMSFPNIRKYSIFAFWGRAPRWWHLQLPIFSFTDVDNLQPFGFGSWCKLSESTIIDLEAS